MHVCIMLSHFRHVLRLGDPMDCNPPGTFFHGILQARIIERALGTCRMEVEAAYCWGSPRSCWTQPKMWGQVAFALRALGSTWKGELKPCLFLSGRLDRGPLTDLKEECEWKIEAEWFSPGCLSQREKFFLKGKRCLWHFGCRGKFSQVRYLILSVSLNH